MTKYCSVTFSSTPKKVAKLHDTQKNRGVSSTFIYDTLKTDVVKFDLKKLWA